MAAEQKTLGQMLGPRPQQKPKPEDVAPQDDNRRVLRRKQKQCE